MAQPREEIPTTATEVVGARRGGPAHLIDGLKGGRALITKTGLSGNILPDASKIVPEGANPAYEPK